MSYIITDIQTEWN